MPRSPRLLSLLALAAATLLALAGLTLTGPASTAAAPSGPTTSVGQAARLGASGVTYRNVSRRERIAMPIRHVRTSALPRGKRKVTRWGHPGAKVVTYRVKFRDGEAVSARKVRSRVVRRPLARIIKVGTGSKQGGNGGNCSPHYRGACVPIASDVDCAGGSGNGPRYVQGPVYVVDYDIYDLDSDGDGVGCES